MISSRERTATSLARIAEADRTFNAFVHVDAERARVAAAAADRRAAKGDRRGPLDGLTFAMKDNLAVDGQEWAAGVAGRRGIVAPADATAVVRLRAAGAVPVGRTNMEEAAFGAVTDNPVFGRTDNPLRPGHVAGGSSGGSAAGVAAGFVELALGTDTMGSVRIPAAYCGIFGLKPTFGLIGRGGLAMLAPSLDTIGILASDVRLLWPATAALAGFDAADPSSLAAPKGWADRTDSPEIAGLRIAIPQQIGAVDCEPEILEGLRIAREALTALGAEVVEADLAGWDPAPARRAGLLVMEAEGAVELAELMDREGALSAPLLAALRFGRDAPSAKIVGALARIRAAAFALRRALSGMGSGTDLVLLPTAPQRAFPHGQPPPANQAEFTAPANFAGLPAVSLPVWPPGETLPAAVQLIGPAWSEARLTGWAERLAGALPRRPG